MAAGGSTRRAGWSTGRCPRTTSRRNRRSTTRCTTVQSNPTRELHVRAENPFNPSGSEPGSEVYPFVLTTFRLTEHHTAGGMSRTLPFLSELMPEMFVEVSPQLAELRGLENGGWATLVTARSAIEARVLVTARDGAAHRRRAHRPPARAAVSLGRKRFGTRRFRERPAALGARRQRAHHGDQGLDGRHHPRPPAARAGAAGRWSRSTSGGRASRARRGPDERIRPIPRRRAAGWITRRGWDF